MNKWAKNLAADDMPTSDLRMIANLCGVEVAVKLVENLAGLPIYIPSSAVKTLQRQYIRKSFDGTSQKAKELALECGVSLAYIYNVVRPGQAEEDESKKQLNLFGT